MLQTTVRAARDRIPTLAARNRVHALGISPSGRPRQAAALVYGSWRTVLRTSMSTNRPLQPNKIDKEFERQAAQKILEARPEEVTTTSSLPNVRDPKHSVEEDRDVVGGLKGELNTIKQTFALASVPRHAYALGLAGTLPYFATSLSTVFLSWNLNTDVPTTSNFINSFILSHDTAMQWLQTLEPIQVGYGAVIISFLGAIHWGLELGEKAPARNRTLVRYGIGVLAPAVAWPTIFMPVEWGLITQFVAFCGLYAVDSHVTKKGWTPGWYGTYRFVLTAIVGAAILVTLIGRYKAEVADKRPPIIPLQERVKGKPSPSIHQRDWAKEEAEERRRLKEEKEREEARKEEERKREEEKRKAEEKKKAEEEKGAADTSDKDKDQEKDRKRKEGGVSA